ncbi:MAG: permease prefix domain 1-containing protein [Clostridiales bacterium]|nr:permease prefix domain 1-containing protein [Clostridiales bacterium]
MEPIIRDYIENLFSSAPRTKQAYELKEEIIRNTIDRYHDLIDEGKSDGDAYNQAIAGIGDINELIDELRSEECFDGGGFTEVQSTNVRKRSRVFHSVAAALYIMCIAPCVIAGVCSIIPVMSLAFYMISAATGLLIYCHMTRQIPFITDEAEKKQCQA